MKLEKKLILRDIRFHWGSYFFQERMKTFVRRFYEKETLQVRLRKQIVLCLYSAGGIHTPAMMIHAVYSQVLPFLRFRYQNYNLGVRMNETTR